MFGTACLLAGALALPPAKADYDRAAADAVRDGIDAEVARSRERVAAAQARLVKRARLTDYAALAEKAKVAGREVCVWSAAFQKAVDENEIVVVPASGEPYWMNATLKMPSNRRIEATGAEIAAVDGFAGALVMNAAWQDGVEDPSKGAPDANVSIVGGVWNMRATCRSVDHDAVMMFSNLKGLRLADLAVERACEFAVQISDAKDVVCERICFKTCFADGVHLNGPVKCVSVRNISGKVGDDLVALNAYDWPGCSHDFGPIRHVVVEDIENRTGIGNPEDDMPKSMRLLPGWHRYADGSEVECSIENVIVRRCNGNRSFKVYFQSRPYSLADGPDAYHYANGRPGREDNIFFEDLVVDLDHPPDMLPPCRTGDPEIGHSAAWELGADIGSVYIRNVDVFAGLAEYPHLKVAQVGPKTYGLPGREAGDPYMNCSVARLVLDDVRIHGGAMAQPVGVHSFDDINKDGMSSGRGSLGELVLANVRQVDDKDFRRLRGAVGEKADRLFESRLLSAKARGDVFEETVNAFRTRYDDTHEDPPGARRRSGYWQGEYWGKAMLSHCAYARYSGDEGERAFIHEKAVQLVEGFQREDGYLGTYADADFIVGNNWNIWSRKYTMWALVEAYDITRDGRLLAAARAMAVHLNRQLKAKKVAIGETGCFAGLPSMSILKPLLMVYRRTGDGDARELIEHIVAENDRADGRCPNLVANAFTGGPVHTWYPKPQEWAKAYELMSVVEGLIQYAADFKSPRQLEAAKRIFDKLAAHEMNGVCSVGYHDHFVGSRACPNAISESCDVVHWMRLCKFLYKATGEQRYLDFWERAFLNAFMAGVFRDGRWATHDVRSHGRRHLQGVFEVGMYYHFCCIANDPRGFCDYADMAFEEATPTTYNLNFYTDGDYRLKSVHVEVSGDYPVGDRVAVRVRTPRALTLSLRMPEGFSFALAGADARRTADGRLAASIPAGETALALEFDMPARIESWKTDTARKVDADLDLYLRGMFEMPQYNKEMAGFLRGTDGVRVFRGPLLLAKGTLAGDCDRQVFGDLGIDETWKATLLPRPRAGTWGCWNVTFEKDGVRKTVGAGDYQSIADFDDWRNSFSIWF